MSYTDHDREQVAANLRAALARRKMNASSLARLLSWTRATAYRRLNGQAEIPTSELIAVARALEISTTELLSGTEQISEVPA